MVRNKVLQNRIKGAISKQLFGEEFSCIVCHEERLENRHNYLCDNCYGQIEFIKNPCAVCGGETIGSEKICSNCYKEKRFFDKAISVAKYSGSAKILIHKLKYFSMKYVSECIVNFLVERLLKEKINRIDRVIAVPLNRERIRERGYNQAEILAEMVADRCSLNFSKNICLRIKATPSQTHLTKQQREENMKGAFFVQDNLSLKGENILVIDDVFTTGATMNGVAKVLKEKGADKVYALTFCHT